MVGKQCFPTENSVSQPKTMFPNQNNVFQPKKVLEWLVNNVLLCVNGCGEITATKATVLKIKLLMCFKSSPCFWFTIS